MPATMPNAATPDFRLYHSNSLEVLAGLLANELRTPAPGQALLAPDIVLIPQVAMRRWLQATLAAEHGIAANLEFLTPGEFVARALDANVDGSGDDLDAATLQWRLYAALNDPALLVRPALAQIAAYLSGSASRPPDPLKPWSLAGELAGVFEKYQAWRRDWLLRWEDGADADDPQAILWRRVAGGRGYRARRIQHYLDRFEGADKPLPRGLPPRLFAFATLNVSPDVLRVIATQARVGTLHFHVPSPVKDYWGDLQRLRAGQPADDENRLLQAWGAAGRDFMAVIGDYELVHPGFELHGDADPGEGGGALHGSLLRRLQSDLFHRRAQPAGERLKDVRKDDPSLQVHACHTRLRELQVLHDQLRALLEDPRFDPPLQPREIAVLAPDIDPYSPYLEAVFGVVGGSDRLPYAVADTSPLANEPLADVFLRLLDLPVSRFGLHEILDLLASPPIAEGAGLAPADFERLRDWLQGAGARWGLDAAHRAAHGAPRDDASTWQFALDRLLLGHAIGDDTLLDVDGQRIAPWPGLEGSALDALDTLLRLLRVLARQQSALSESLTPREWRERLLHLLEALFPREPAQPASQRALDRLRKLIDDFATRADAASFDGAVPADVVRAHFSAQLAEADTRAPLLTGGISFGRMVPMRLLPFRVICVLGMNDGDYPRRDAAAGLNRLTAELGTDKRRNGDRSTREDDRFLFLQLFAAAQDVFYLSYLGADPRDGSVREPSVLVSELIDAAAQYHADADAAQRDLVVRHSLQPFSSAAFGGEDPRRFSYRAQWHPAAGWATARRTPLPPWFAGDAMPVMEESEASLSIDAVRRVLVAPAEQFLRQRLGLRLDGIEDAGEDVEPLLMPERGRARSEVQAAVFEAVLRGDDDATVHARLRAQGLLPSGPLGQHMLATLRQEVTPYAQAFAAWRGDEVPARHRVEVDLGEIVLHGTLGDAYPHGLARLRIGMPNGPSAIRDGLHWLLASAVGIGLPLVQFHEEGKGGFGPHVRDALEPEHARAVLRHLLALRDTALREPLPFASYSGWEFFTAAPDWEKGFKEAAKKWHGSERSWSEGDGDAVRLALRGRDPFGDVATRVQFANLSMAIYAAVTQGEIHGGLDEDALRALSDTFDAEEAE